MVWPGLVYVSSIIHTFVNGEQTVENGRLTRANIFSTLIPAVSAAGAAMLGQEAITFSKIAGISIVIAGVILAQHTKK